jgi:hypothetical protein
MVEALKFEVGGTYENMKGPYEVISIQRDSMVIRWHDGLEIVTSVELQQRIIERIAMDKVHESKLSAGKPKKSETPKKKKSAPFSGFKEEDFETSAKKTAWRGRNSVGGAVIKELNSDQMEFGAWAISTQPELHWMEKSRHERQDPHHGIGFFARVDAQTLAYGLYVKPASVAGQVAECWDGFQTWLASNTNESWLKQQSKDHDLCIRDASGKVLSQEITCRDDRWEYKEGKVRHKIDSLSTYFASIPDLNLADLRIEKRMSKADALPEGKKIVDTMASLFHALMPFYLVATVPAE